MVAKMLRLASLLALGATFVQGQQVNGETGPDNATTPAYPQGEITVHQIAVGKTQNTFTPNSIQAKTGDIVQFTFYPTNHSVIRAAYGYPCIPYEDVVSSDKGSGSGFYSGPQLVNDTAVLPQWNMTINNTEPIFFYCGAPGSCFGWGMLGVINANNDTDLSKQIAIARQEQYETWPGMKPDTAALASLISIANTATIVTSASSTATSASSATSSASASATAAAAAAASSSSLSGGAIAGIAIGAALVVLVAAGLFFFLGRTHRNKKEQQQLLQQGQPAHVPGPEGNYMPSPGFSKAHMQLPPYMPSSEMKGPYGEHSVQYIGQDPMHSPPAQYTEHPSYVDYRHHSPPPPQQQSIRHSLTSELDGGAVPTTVRASPALGSVQELETPATRHE